MKSKKKEPVEKIRTWDAFQKEHFAKNPEEALEYLRISFEQNYDLPEAIVDAIRTVTEALGLSLNQIAKKAKIPASSIYKALGNEGNPSLKMLTSILEAMGYRLTITKAS